MRIGIGKSFGSFHIGTSVSTKGIGKGLWNLIVWPFYLMYYVCIWPFVAIYRAVTKKKKVKKATATAEANRYLEILNESSKICSETRNPETFFSRMSLIDDTIDKLITYEGVIHFTGEKPSEVKQKFNSNRAQAVNDFIERYAKDTRIKIYELKTKSSKINKANAFYNILYEYSDKMPSESIAKLTEIAEQLKSLANQNIE
ncbi:MAG: hypothetical protein IJ289_09680 [Clostridia bacterium]|nr:hypothetical protein [Clostridia bacterium]